MTPAELETGPQHSAVRGPHSAISRRMLVWMIAVPAALLLLALAGANWKVFHLAYCRHLMRSSSAETRFDGLRRLGETYLVKGMSREEVSRMVRPLKLEVVGNRMKMRIAYIVGTWSPGKSGQGLQIHFADGKYQGCNEMLWRRVKRGREVGTGVRLLIGGLPGSDAKMEFFLNTEDLLKTDVADWPGNHR